MSVFCESLPSRLEWRMFGGDFSKYEEALYEVFMKSITIEKNALSGTSLLLAKKISDVLLMRTDAEVCHGQGH